MTTVTSSSFLLAVDIGGTKTAVALIAAHGDPPQGAILAQQQEPTKQEGPSAAIAHIVRLLRETAAMRDVALDQVRAIGVSIPAVLREDDHVAWAPNLHGWRDVALAPELQSALALPVLVEYDGHAAVLGEYWAGAGRGYHTLANVIIGTGIGGGLILDGRLLRGRDRLAGAAGWFTLSAHGSEPSAQNKGQWEAIAAGPAIARRARRALSQEPEPGRSSSALAGVSPLQAQHVFDAARQGDRLAAGVVHESARLIGLGVANVVSLVNPQIVILGGSIGCQGDLLLPVVRHVVTACAQPASAADLPIISSRLGAEASLLGAAYAALLRLSRQKEEVTLLS